MWPTIGGRRQSSEKKKKRIENFLSFLLKGTAPSATMKFSYIFFHSSCTLTHFTWAHIKTDESSLCIRMWSLSNVKAALISWKSKIFFNWIFQKFHSKRFIAYSSNPLMVDTVLPTLISNFDGNDFRHSFSRHRCHHFGLNSVIWRSWWTQSVTVYHCRIK